MDFTLILFIAATTKWIYAQCSNHFKYIYKTDLRCICSSYIENVRACRVSTITDVLYIILHFTTMDKTINNKQNETEVIN